jgi:hypothetical protein
MAPCSNAPFSHLQHRRLGSAILTGKSCHLLYQLETMPETDTQVLSIDFQRIRKGDVISREQIEHHYIHNIVGEDAYNVKLAEFEAGERVEHPIGQAHMIVAVEIQRRCAELGYRVVCRTRHKVIEVLTDSQAMQYRHNNANSALGRHRRQVKSLYSDIDEDRLTPQERRSLADMREYHTMIELSVSSGKRTLKEMQKGKLRLG